MIEDEPCGRTRRQDPELAGNCWTLARRKEKKVYIRGGGSETGAKRPRAWMLTWIGTKRDRERELEKQEKKRIRTTNGKGNQQQARHLGIERLRNACKSRPSGDGSNELLSLTILFKSSHLAPAELYLGVVKWKLHVCSRDESVGASVSCHCAWSCGL